MGMAKKFAESEAKWAKADPCGVYVEDIPWWYKSAVELIFLRDREEDGDEEEGGEETPEKLRCAWFKKHWKVVIAVFVLLTLPIAAAVDYKNPARGVAGLVGFYVVCAVVLGIIIPFAKSMWGGWMS